MVFPQRLLFFKCAGEAVGDHQGFWLGQSGRTCGDVDATEVEIRDKRSSMILASGRVREQLRSWEVPGDANWDIYIYDYYYCYYYYYYYTIIYIYIMILHSIIYVYYLQYIYIYNMSYWDVVSLPHYYKIGMYICYMMPWNVYCVCYARRIRGFFGVSPPQTDSYVQPHLGEG